MEVKVKKLHKDARLPEYATAGSGAFDLFSLSLIGDDLPHTVGLSSGDRVIFSTGLAFEIPEGSVMLVFSRSGHGFKDDISLSNCVGVIDSDYRGELKIKLRSDKLFCEGTTTVNHHDRIAQALILPVERVKFLEVSKLSDTVRGEGGFGSTGK